MDRRNDIWIPLPESAQTMRYFTAETSFAIKRNSFDEFKYNPGRKTHQKMMTKFIDWCGKYDPVYSETLISYTK